MIGRSVSAPSNSASESPASRARLAELGCARCGARRSASSLEPRGDLGRRALRLARLEPNRHPNAAHWDEPTLTHDLGWVTDVWARWDSVWFLRIAEHGYGATRGVAAAFYPLYPLTLAGPRPRLRRALRPRRHRRLARRALVAFVLLYRLAEERLGAEGARRAVLYLAVFPMALFLGAVYTESLYLLLAIAAFLLAERGRLVGAGPSRGSRS